MAVEDIGPLDWRVSIVDKSGRPSPEFQRRWNANRSNTALIGTITFGSGVPTGTPQDGAQYADVSTDPFTLYIGLNKTWHKADVTQFKELSDVPHSYAGQATKVVRVNAAATGLDFTDQPYPGVRSNGQDKLKLGTLGAIVPSGGIMLRPATVAQGSIGLGIVSYAGAGDPTPIFRGFSTDGTPGAETAVGAGFGLVQFSGFAFDGSNFAVGTRFLMSTAEPWTSTAHGALLTFATVKVGTTGITERVRIDDAGNFVLANNSGAYTTRLATTATDGFFYINSTAGTPTGVPAKAATYSGQVPLVVDVTNGKLWGYYGSAWNSLSGSGGGGGYSVVGDTNLTTVQTPAVSYYLFRLTAVPQNITVNKIAFMTSVASPSCQYTVGVYTDSNGPTTLLGTSTQVTGVAAGYNEASLTVPLNLVKGQLVWLAISTATAPISNMYSGPGGLSAFLSNGGSTTMGTSVSGASTFTTANAHYAIWGIT